jgi:hypothetical protein
LGSFTSTRPESLVLTEGKMNSEKLGAIVKRRVSPAVEKNFPLGDRIFQHERAPCRGSRRVKKVIEKLKINTRMWPGNSRYLNPIEKIRGIAKGRLGKMDWSVNELLICNMIKM